MSFKIGRNKMYEEEPIQFNNDDEFADFCVAPYAEIKGNEKEGFYVGGDYSEEYKKALAEGKHFQIKNENSVVYKRMCVLKRVPVRGTRRTYCVQLKVQNLEPYFEDL